MPLRRPREEGFQWTQDLGDVIACVAISQHAGRPPVVAAGGMNSRVTCYYLSGAHDVCASFHVRDGDGVTGVALLWLQHDRLKVVAGTFSGVVVGWDVGISPLVEDDGNSFRSRRRSTSARRGTFGVRGEARLPLLPGVADELSTSHPEARVRFPGGGAVHAISASCRRLRGGATADAAPELLVVGGKALELELILASVGAPPAAASASAVPPLTLLPFATVPYPSSVRSVSVDDAASLLAVAGDAGTVEVWALEWNGDVTAPPRVGRTPVHSRPYNRVVHAVALSPEAGLLAVGTDENVTLCEIHREDMLGGGELRVEPLLMVAQGVKDGGIAFSHDDGSTRASNGRVKFKDDSSPKISDRSSLQRMVVASGLDVQVLSVATGAALRYFPRDEGRVRCVALSSTGRQLALGGFDRALTLIAVDDGARLFHYSFGPSCRRPNPPPPRPTTKPRDGDDSFKRVPRAVADRAPNGGGRRRRRPRPRRNRSGGVGRRRGRHRRARRPRCGRRASGRRRVQGRHEDLRHVRRCRPRGVAPGKAGLRFGGDA